MCGGEAFGREDVAGYEGGDGGAAEEGTVELDLLQ